MPNKLLHPHRVWNRIAHSLATLIMVVSFTGCASDGLDRVTTHLEIHFRAEPETTVVEQGNQVFGVSMGTVVLHQSRAFEIHLKNTSSLPIEIASPKWRENSLSWKLANTPSGAILGPHESLILNLLFTATNEGIHENELQLDTTATNAPRVVIELDAFARAPYSPEAHVEFLRCVVSGSQPNDITLPKVCPPLSFVQLDAAQSVNLENTTDNVEMHYSWTLVSAPSHANTAQILLEDGSLSMLNKELSQGLLFYDNIEHFPEFSVGSSEQPYFFLPVVGEYVFEVHVTTTIGDVSGPESNAQIRIEAKPQSQIYMEMTWDDTNYDIVDMHLTVGEALGKLCVDDLDCGPWDPTPYWFDAPLGRGPNPRADTGNLFSPAVRSISRVAPVDYAMRLYIHFGVLGNEDRASLTPTLRVYRQGTLAAEFSRELEPGNVWAVTDIVASPAGTFDLFGLTYDEDVGPGVIAQVPLEWGTCSDWEFRPHLDPPI